MNPVADHEIALSDFAHRLAAELESAAEACRQAQELAARLASEGGAPLHRLEPLQALDELTQRLSSLSLVMLRLAGQAGEHRLAAGPLLDEIALSDLAGRLRADPPPAAGAVRSGEPDLF